MKLYGSTTSPFVRAARIAAIETDLDQRIEFVPTVVKPTERNTDYGAQVNPLRRVPALETDDGRVIIDSRVVVEHLNELAGADIIPPAGPSRIDCLNRYAVVSGAMEALVLCMYETRLRPAEKRWPEWLDDQMNKTHTALEWADARVSSFSADFDLGAIGLVCLLDYAAFRFGEVDWLGARPGLRRYLDDVGARPSVSETAPNE